MSGPGGAAKGQSSDAKGAWGSKLTLEIILPLLGATAGLTFVLYFTGAIVEYRRFQTLMLPGTQTIAPLSHDSLVAVGARHLAPPALAAITTALLFVFLVKVVPLGGHDPSVPATAEKTEQAGISRRSVVIAAVMLAGIGALVWNGPGDLENLAFIVLVEVAATSGWIVSWWIARPANKDRLSVWPRSTAGAALLLAIAVAGTSAFFVGVHVWRPPVDLEYAHVDLRNQKQGEACGIYLALTDDYLYLAPATRTKNENGDVLYLTHRRAVAIPVSDVRRFTLSLKEHVEDDSDAPPGVRSAVLAEC